MPCFPAVKRTNQISSQKYGIAYCNVRFFEIGNAIRYCELLLSDIENARAAHGDLPLESVPRYQRVGNANWVYMDPTFEAWWTDAQGQVLGLQAARELLAAEDTVMLNREANTNGQRREAPDHLAYMSKNVFRFRTWLADGAALELVPCDYDTSDAGAVHAGGTRRNITRNPAVFWAAPPRR